MIKSGLFNFGFWLRAVVSACIIFLINACSAGNSDDANTRSNSSNSLSISQRLSTIAGPFGNPSAATQDVSNKDNYLIIGTSSVISYNSSRGTANWIYWKTTENDLGTPLERPLFMPDPRLPPDFEKIDYYAYSGSGYERGHLVPSADRFADKNANLETFYMTNIVPQRPALNQFVWEGLESYIRRQVRRGLDAYQIAGVYGEQGRLKNKVTVPTNCWKIVVLMPKGLEPDPSDPRARIIAVDIPNQNGIEKNDWRMYATTIRFIESKTGLDFFRDWDRVSQDRIESKIEIENK
nr:DNA/RNA non-specific endonuclease [Pyrinomonadaceae bacterium]